MQSIIFSFFDSAELATAIAKYCHYEIGEITLRSFPDEETHLKINSNIKDRNVIFVANLVRPNDKILPLLFAAETARNLGAKSIALVAPYLPYMRQDKQFSVGEGITAKYFATIISNYFDSLITVDPHLHRLHSLSEIYQIPTFTLHAADLIADWIKNNVTKPLVIGPDRESGQWAEEVAQKVQAPFVVLEKNRKSDYLVEISIPHLEKYKDYTPVLVDDIISTAKTMIETIKQLNKAELLPPICIGIHAVFSGNAYEALLQAGAAKVITCNTIRHTSNGVDLAEQMAKEIKKINL